MQLLRNVATGGRLLLAPTSLLGVLAIVLGIAFWGMRMQDRSLDKALHDIVKKTNTVANIKSGTTTAHAKTYRILTHIESHYPKQKIAEEILDVRAEMNRTRAYLAELAGLPGLSDQERRILKTNDGLVRAYQTFMQDTLEIAVVEIPQGVVFMMQADKKFVELTHSLDVLQKEQDRSMEQSYSAIKQTTNQILGVLLAVGIGALILFFSRMLGRSYAVAEEKRAVLEAFNQELETRVEQRTQQLEAQVVKVSALNHSMAIESAERERAEAALHKVQADLVASARQAGMAEIAANVLHNVGNVLNSVNVSAGLVNSKMRESKARGLVKAVQLMDEHGADLGHFLTEDDKGKLLPAYLSKAVAALAAEQRDIVGELEALTRSVDHIKDIVAMQQSYAGAASVVEPVQIRDLLEDALRMHSASLARSQVVVVREFADLPALLLDKPRLLQILVNLISNARQAMAAVPDRRPQMTLRAEIAGAGAECRLRIRVEDEGEGIAPENLVRIFSHGFTTHKHGHGFGLHSCVLAAQAMGGTLMAHSAGAGMGATFTLELPIKPVEEMLCAPA